MKRIFALSLVALTVMASVAMAKTTNIQVTPGDSISVMAVGARSAVVTHTRVVYVDRGSNNAQTARLEKKLDQNTAAVNALTKDVDRLISGMRYGAYRFSDRLSRWWWLWLIVLLILVWAFRRRDVNVNQTNTCHGGIDCYGHCPYQPMNLPPSGSTKSERSTTGVKTITATVTIPDGMEDKPGLEVTACTTFISGPKPPTDQPTTE